MGTITKQEEQNVVTITLRVSKKQIRLLMILLTITFVAGITVFFMMPY